jgi:hypothetical protein
MGVGSNGAERTGKVPRAVPLTTRESKCVCVNFICPRAGALVGNPRLGGTAGTVEFPQAVDRDTPGGPIKLTRNDFSYPLLVHLVASALRVLLRDYATARYLDGDGFYEIEES